MSNPITVISPSGKWGTVPFALLEKAKVDGYRIPTQEEIRQHAKKERQDDVAEIAEEYGGTATAAGALRGATLGGSDLLMRALGVEDDTLKAVKDAHPGKSLAGEVLGSAAGVALGGAGLAKLGASAGKTAVAQSIAKTGVGSAVKKAAQKKAVQYGVGSAIEGALISGGSMVSEAALGEDVDHVGQKLLAGAGIGVVSRVAGGGYKLARYLIRSTKSKATSVAANAVLQKLTAPQVTKEVTKQATKKTVKKAAKEATNPNKRAEDLYLLGNAERAVKKTDEKVRSRIQELLSASMKPIPTGSKREVLGTPVDAAAQWLPVRDTVVEMINDIRNIDQEQLVSVIEEENAELAGVAPRLTRAMNNQLVNQIRFLQSKLPPDQSDNSFYQSKLSDEDISRFNRYATAVNDPLSVISHPTQEGIEVLQSLYPSLYTEIKSRTMEAIVNQKLDYKTRLRVSMLLDMPLEKTYQNEYLQMLHKPQKELEQPQSRRAPQFHEMVQTDISKLE